MLNATVEKCTKNCRFHFSKAKTNGDKVELSIKGWARGIQNVGKREPIDYMPEIGDIW